GGLIYALSSIESMLTGEGIVAFIILAIGVVSLVLFVLRQLQLGKKDKAFLDLRPFAIRNFTLSVSVILVSFGAMLGFATVLPIYLQTSGRYRTGDGSRGHARWRAAGDYVAIRRPSL